MIIKKLTLHNFGVYASTNTFSFKGEKPIVLIGGMNGRGKTTFLEAVLLALYGSNSFAYNESQYNSFGQYLKSFVNTTDGTMISYVDLEFTMDSDSIEIYRIHREWTGEKKRISESISVYKDGDYNPFLTENWAMFIENVLPSGLSNFFFFDGEKIAELAVENTNAQMKESIKALLGITVLDRLEADIRRIIKRTLKNSIDDSETKEIERLRSVRDEAVAALKDLDEEIQLLEVKKAKVTQALEKKREDYSAKGGDIVAQKQELFRERTEISGKMSTLQDQLIIDAGSELPLLLVEKLLKEIRIHAEIEQDQRTLAVALERMESLFSEYKEERKGETDVSKTEDFISFVRGKIKSVDGEPSYKLTDNGLFRLQSLLDEKLKSSKKEVINRKAEIHKLKERADQIDSYTSIEIDEKAISKIFRQIKEMEQEIISIDVTISKKQDERRSCNGAVIVASAEFNKKVETYLKRVELNDDGDRLKKYSHMADSILEEYKVRLQERKISNVAKVMTDCYKRLANKKNLIDRIEMDPISLDLIYINNIGEIVNKASLSAGEKQLMVISLLWALAICSKKKLPVIIDTPLSRLDSAHRISLITTYFPNASDQTIILSTDSEIDQTYYNIIKENVGDEFTLIYDDQTKSTSIHEGYFLGGFE